MLLPQVMRPLPAATTRFPRDDRGVRLIADAPFSVVRGPRARTSRSGSPARSGSEVGTGGKAPSGFA
jgi:hypothetical protein